LARRFERVPAGCWVVLLTLPALVPLARPGFFESHDGLFHAYRLAALDQAVRSGVLYPRWFPEFAFGYGHPVLNFYGPLSYYAGLPFTLLGLDASTALQLVFACGLVASALGMLLFARLHLDRGPAIVAAVVYAYLPYHLVDLYVRGALAEFLAFVWFPLVLWAFHKLLRGSGRHRVLHLSLAAMFLGALVLTHHLSALLFVPALLAYVVILVWAQPSGQTRGRAALEVTLALALAVTLTTFYWMPVLTESRYVGLGYGVSQGYRDHLLRWASLISLSPTYGYPTTPGVSPVYPLGLVQLAILLAASVLPFRLRAGRWPVVFFLAVAWCSAYMLTIYSLPVWRPLEPVLAFLQYPWRFQALTVLATAFLAGAVVQGFTRPRHWSRWALGLALVLGSALWALWRVPLTPSEPDLSVEAMWQKDRDAGQVGATWTGEYLPIWVSEQRWAISHPAPVVPAEAQVAAGQMELAGVAYTGYSLAVPEPQPTHVVLHQFYYPGWQATWQRERHPAHPESALGLAAFDLPPGSGALLLRLGLTPSQLWGSGLSAAIALGMAVALVAGLGCGRSRSAPHPPPERRAALASGLAACCTLLAGILLVSILWPSGFVRAVRPANANLENTVELLSSLTGKARYRPGETLDVTLYWRALRSLDRDYKAFVHLTDADLTRQPAQQDSDPGGGFTPVSRWLPGEIVPDTHHLPLPADLPPGRYLIWAGMYEYETVRNLEVLSADVPHPGNRVLVGEIEVTNR
jgi:hypothetical protein